LLLAAGLAAGAIYFFSGKFTTVRFERERIEVQVDGQVIHVKGLYYYTNKSRLPAVLNLRIPFPIDPDHAPPVAFTLYESSAEGDALEELPAVERGEDAYLRLIFRPGEARWIRLDYTQPTRLASGRYLLTTTRAWRRPIHRADFALRLPSHARLTSSNYTLQAAGAEGKTKTYTFSRTDFYPEHDWEFSWAETGAELASAEGRQP